MQHRLDGFYFTFPLSNHEKLKNTLITQIDESKQIENNKPKADDYYSESISKLDWSWSKDFSRPTSTGGRDGRDRGIGGPGRRGLS